jgi:hypothetical protein
MAGAGLLILGISGLAAGTTGCGLLGPGCLDRQKTGHVTSFVGRVGPGQVATHLLPYDLKGSQNNVEIAWSGQGQAGAPRLRLFATNAGCLDFVPPQAGETDGDPGCTVISRGGGYLAPDARPCAVDGSCTPNPDEVVNTSMIVTGPGNGATPDFREYKLHVVGDPGRESDYSVDVTWFSGPDC